MLNFFDFGKLKFITSVPPFEVYNGISVIGTKYFSTYIYDPTWPDKDYSNIKRNLVSNNFDVIIPFTNFLRLGSFDSENSTPYNYNLNQQTQIDNDSLLLFSRSIKNRKVDFGEIYGLYKLNVGEVVPPIYRYITRVSDFFSIITNQDKSMNIINLKDYKKYFKSNYDDIIYYREANHEENYLQCTIDGKIDKYYIKSNQILKY